MNEKIVLHVLGGMDSFGANLFALELGDDIFVYSPGLGYPDKNAPGIDFVISDFDYLRKNKERVKAYIVPNSHDDSYGAIPFIYTEVPAPIYMSKYTRIIFAKFLKDMKFTDRKFNVIAVDPNGDIEIGGRLIRFFQVAYASPESFGVAFSTSQGNVVFSGDYIFEYSKFKGFQMNFKKLNLIAEEKTLLLLMDAKNASYSGYTSPHHRVDSEIRKQLNDSDGKMYIACYSQWQYTFIEIITECLRAERKICFYDEESRFVYQSMKMCEIFSIPQDSIISVDEIGRIPDSKIAIIMTGMGKEIYKKITYLTSREVSDSKLCINQTDTFILACPPSSNFEVIGVSVIDELYKYDCKVVNIPSKKIRRMHPSDDDIKLLVSLLAPDYFVPIKGDYRELTACAMSVVSINIGLNHRNVFVMENYQEIDFTDKTPKITYINDQIYTVGRLMIDGNGIGDVASEVLTERNILGTDGVVVMSCLISLQEKQITGGPDVQMRGYLYLKESEATLKGITAIFVDIVNKHLTSNNFDVDKCYAEIKEQCSKYCRRTTQRNPLIEPYIVVIN